MIENGSISVLINGMNSVVRPRNRNLAKANPAIRSMTTVSAVTAIETTRLFKARRGSCGPARRP